MRFKPIKDSGVCFRNENEVLYLSSRKLYLPVRCYEHIGRNNMVYFDIIHDLSGCALRCCKFPTLTCDKCSFNY